MYRHIHTHTMLHMECVMSQKKILDLVGQVHEMRDHIYVYTYTHAHHVAHGMREMSQEYIKKICSPRFRTAVHEIGDQRIYTNLHTLTPCPHHVTHGMRDLPPKYD